MKKGFTYVAAILFAVLAVGCDDKIEEFEIDGFTGTPATIETVDYEALPGMIQLNWNVPAGDFSYLKIWYLDPLTQQTVYNIASKGTNNLLLEGTRKRFGEYEVFFQTFNANNEGGEAKSFKVQSGPAPATYTLKSRTQIPLTVDQLSSNAADPSEGKLADLIDNNKGTFFHSNWHEVIPYPQWIQMNLKEPHENFIVGYINRNNGGSDGRPANVDLQISNDGQNWETATTLSGLPTGQSSEYASNFVMPGKTFTYFRFSVTSSSNSKTWWNIAEIMLYDAEVEVYDPETVALN